MTKKMSKTSLFLYGSALVMAGVGSAALYSQFSTFNLLIAQYVEQGYDKAEVVAQLVPNQLLPAMYSTISLNLGFTLALIGLGLVVQKMSQLATPSVEVAVEAATVAVPVVEASHPVAIDEEASVEEVEETEEVK